MDYIVISKNKYMSKLFLFPLLNVKKNNLSFRTYLYWEGNKDMGIEEYELLVYFKHERDKSYLAFEQELVKNPYIQRCYILEEGTVYGFDMTVFNDEVDKFLKGEYSQFSDESKKLIKKYWGEVQDPSKTPKEAALLIAFHPEYYRKLAEEEMEMELPGELCGIFDKKIETFSGNIINTCCGEELMYSLNSL